MVFSVMLWMPSWGGMINGLLTLRGAWDKVRRGSGAQVLRRRRSRPTAWRRSRGRCSRSRASTRSRTTPTGSSRTSTRGALGWNGFMTFGMIYWLLPRLFQTQLYCKKLAEAALLDRHASASCSTSSSIYSAGVTQGLMWRAFDETGRLQYPGLRRDRRAADARCTGCAPSAARSTSSACCCSAGTSCMTWQPRPAMYDDAGDPGRAARARAARRRTRPRAGAGGAWARFIGLRLAPHAGRGCRLAVHASDGWSRWSSRRCSRSSRRS